MGLKMLDDLEDTREFKISNKEFKNQGKCNKYEKSRKWKEYIKFVISI